MQRSDFVPTFGERLKQLRLEKRVTQREIADYLGIATNAYQNYEYDKRDMNIKSLTTLADYFDVSIDYLTGRSDNPKRI